EIELAQMREHRRGADGRVTGELHLRPGREDAHAQRRENESRLREVELARDRLHRAVRKSLRVRKDAELIAAERLVGEDVGDDEALHNLPPCCAERFSVSVSSRWAPGRRRSSIPRLRRIASSFSRATTARTPSTASSGGTSPGGWQARWASRSHSSARGRNRPATIRANSTRNRSFSPTPR